MNILDWEYYNSHFPKISEDEFNKLNYSCSVLTECKLIKPISELTENELIKVKDCICNVINYNYSVSESQNISSVSNDSYSVSYVQKTQEQSKNEIDNIFDTWLGYLKKSGYICF